MIVLDTNVVSELMKPKPNESVAAWVRTEPARDLFTTSVTLAEVLYGIERLPDGKRKELLRTTASGAFAAFGDQVLPFDAGAAAHYATIVATRDQLGHPINGFDAQIAAICRTNGGGLATRNTKDFEHTGIDLTDPWHG
jgi:predicted nucleic acid-binding protein